MPKTELDPVSNRLDAILRLLVEYLKQEKNWNAGDIVLLLQSSGLRGVEIAKILGVKDTSLPGIIAYAKNKDLKEKLKAAK
jgi:hypothetical protein